MASTTALRARVRALDPGGVRDLLEASPELLDVRDDRGRSWLHLCCGVDVTERPWRDRAASIAIADLLLTLGLDPSDAAFTEGTWRATPVWYAVARGRNPDLARYLLRHGADPNHALWAASFRDDLDAIELLLGHGAAIDAVADGETPFLGAVKTSHFAAAWLLAARGADVNFRDASGMTALHYMLKKRSDVEHFEAIARYGPRVDIPDAAGITAGELLARKRDPRLRAVAAMLRA